LAVCAIRGAGAGTVSRVVWSRRSNELKMQATRADLAVNRLLACLGRSKRAHAHDSRHDDRLLAHSRIKSSEECISRGPLDSSKRWQILREGERCVQMCLVSCVPEISGGGMVRAKNSGAQPKMAVGIPHTLDGQPNTQDPAAALLVRTSGQVFRAL